MSFALTNARKGTGVTASRQRLVAVGFAVALHLAVLVLFLHSHPRGRAIDGLGLGTMNVSLASLSRARGSSSAARVAPVRAAAPAKPAPTAPADATKPRTVLQIVSDIVAIPRPGHPVTPTPQPPVNAPTPEVAPAETTPSGSPNAGCDIGGAVQTALRSDPAAHRAVQLITMRERSAANAMIVWNGQWVSPTDIGEVSPFGILRTVIRQVVVSVSPDCREQVIVGPRFMLIPDLEVTIVVVVGNASWRWSDLLVDRETPAQPSATVP